MGKAKPLSIWQDVHWSAWESRKPAPCYVVSQQRALSSGSKYGRSNMAGLLLSCYNTQLSGGDSYYCTTPPSPAITGATRSLTINQTGYSQQYIQNQKFLWKDVSVTTTEVD